MDIYSERIFKLKESYNTEYWKIKNNPDLTESGKNKAIIELNLRAENDYLSIKRQVKEFLLDHDERLSTLKAKESRQQLTAEEIESLKYQGDLILSQLSATPDPVNFAAVAKEQAAANPAAFELIFKEVVKLAEKVAPKEAGNMDPWSGEIKEVSNAKAARLHAEIDEVFNQARIASIGPEAVKQQEQIAAVTDSMSELQSTISLIDRFITMIKHPSPWPGDQEASDPDVFRRNQATGRRAVYQ